MKTQHVTPGEFDLRLIAFKKLYESTKGKMVIDLLKPVDPDETSDVYFVGNGIDYVEEEADPCVIQQLIDLITCEKGDTDRWMADTLRNIGHLSYDARSICQNAYYWMQHSWGLEHKVGQDRFSAVYTGMEYLSQKCSIQFSLAFNSVYHVGDTDWNEALFNMAFDYGSQLPQE
jgi:hypothetical protein